MNRTKTKVVEGFGTSRYEYDIEKEEGIAERSTDPSGNAVERVYDKLGRLIRVKDGAAESAAGYTYDAAGRIAQEVQETGMRTEYTYDGNNQVLTAKQYKAGEAEPSEETGYTYDNAGNVTQKTSSRTQAATYTYDALNRLSMETIPGDPNATDPKYREFAQKSYTYDAAGNRNYEIRDEEVLTEEMFYTYDDRNRLTGRTSPRGNETYGYDNNGNMTAITRSGGTQSFTYDFCNQMVSATDKTGAGGKEFSYDAEGRLVAENVVGETAERKYLYEGGNIILEKNTDGTETRNLYGHGLLLREEGKSTSAEIIAKHSLEIQYGEKKYYQGDGTGNVTGYLKGNGEEEARYEYYAFGQERKKEGETENPYQYAGARYDETVGMYYMEGSWYYPESGQYINGQRGNESLTRYVYRSNNPLNYADYSGFAPVRPTEEPEKAATNTGWRLQLGMIVENESYIGMDNYAKIILEPTVVLDGYSQRIILEREIVRLNEEEEKRRKRENRRLQEEREAEYSLTDILGIIEIKIADRYVPKERPIVNVGERIENKIGGTFITNPTNGYQIPSNLNLFNNIGKDPFEGYYGTSLYLMGGAENFAYRKEILRYLQYLTTDDLIMEKDPKSEYYIVKAKYNNSSSLPVGTSLIRALISSDYSCYISIDPSKDALSKSWPENLSNSITPYGTGSNAYIVLATNEKVRELTTYFTQSTGKDGGIKGTISQQQIDKVNNTDLIITLGHELIHALRIMRGKKKYSPYVPYNGTYYSIAFEKMITAPAEELDTIGISYSTATNYYAAAGWWFTENSLRREHNMPLRITAE